MGDDAFAIVGLMRDVWWFWILYVATGLVMIGLAWRRARYRRTHSVEAVPVNDIICGRCGYSLRGGVGDVCPECGQDVRDDGRSTRTMRKRQRVWTVGRLVGWTARVALVAGLSLYLAWQSFLPIRIVSRTHQQFGVPEAMRIEERAEWRVFGVRGSRAFSASDPPLPGWHTLTARPGGREAPSLPRLTQDVAAQAWTLETASGQSMSGEQLPSLEAMQAFAEGVTGAPATRPATMALGLEETIVFERQADELMVTPERLRLAVWKKFHDDGPLLYLPKVLRESRHAPFRRGWIALQQHFAATAERAPAGWFEGTTDEFMTLAGHRRFRGHNPTTFEYLEPFPAIAAGGYWLLIWAAGLPFALRPWRVRVVA